MSTDSGLIERQAFWLLARNSQCHAGHHRPRRVRSAGRVAKSVSGHTVEPSNDADGPSRATRRSAPNG